MQQEDIEFHSFIWLVPFAPGLLDQQAEAGRASLHLDVVEGCKADRDHK